MTTWWLPVDDLDAAVYRCIGKRNKLLYVGCSARPVERLRSHARKPWFSEVQTIIVTPLMNRRKALSIERNMIANERPLYNVPYGWNAKDRQQYQRAKRGGALKAGKK